MTDQPVSAEPLGWTALTVLAIDVGGTFTDVVALWRDGMATTTKFLSSAAAEPDLMRRELARWLSSSGAGTAPARGVADHARTRIVHASTVATNALLEGKTAVTALIATEGFADVLEIGRGMRPDPLDLTWRPMPPLVPAEKRIEIKERIGSRGEVVTPLDASSLEQAIDQVSDDVEAVAVCLLNSFANPAHEQGVVERLRIRRAGVFVSASHEVSPEPREYERSSTSVANAALGPVIDRHLQALTESLETLGLTGEIEVMQSNGGNTTAALARIRPVAMVESGPAAGALAALNISRLMGERHVIAFDMGGTTTKATLIEDYQLAETAEYYVGGTAHRSSPITGGSGYVIRTPSLDIVEVGAGGGSLAWVDEAGGLHIGPESAGANPGPACYGLGGGSATVTDANVVAGYISPNKIANGALAIDAGLARDAVMSDVGIPRNLDASRAAYLIHAGANARMLAALRGVTVERGRDPRDHTILAFGGSGPVHAAGLAQLIGVTQVLVPFGAGVLSSAGLLSSGRAADGVRSFHCDLAAADEATLQSEFGMLTESVAKVDGLPAEQLSEAEQLIGIRYSGQQAVLFVPMPESPDDLATALRDAFESEYSREFGFAARAPCEVVSLRLRLRSSTSELWRKLLVGLGKSWMGEDEEAAKHTRTCTFDSGEVECQVLTAGQLAAIAGPVEGPVVVEAPDTTIVVPPGWAAEWHHQIGVRLTWRG